MKKIITTCCILGIALPLYAQGFLYLNTLMEGPFIYNGGTAYSGNISIQIWINPSGTISGVQTIDTYLQVLSGSTGYQCEVTVTMPVFNGLLESTVPIMLNDLTTGQDSVPMFLAVWTGTPMFFSGLGTFVELDAINLGFMNSGTIIRDGGWSLGGYPCYPNGPVEFIDISVPEPSTSALFLFGLGGSGLFFLRRKKCQTF